MPKILSLFDWFIPEAISLSSSEDRIRARMVLLFTFTFMIWVPILAPLMKLFGFQVGMIAFAIAGIVLCCIPFVIRITGSVRLAANLLILNNYALIEIIAWHNGGARAPAITWIIIVPMMAYTCLGTSWGLFWTILAIAQSASFLVFEHFGVVFQVEVDTRFIKLFQIMSLSSIVLGASCLFWLYEFQRKRSEIALRKNQQRLSIAQKVAHLGSWEWNLQSNSVFFSDEIYNLLDRKKTSIGEDYDTFLSTVHPDDRTAVDKAVQEALHDLQTFSIDHRILAPSGKTRMIQNDGMVALDKKGSPISMIGTMLDITERHQSANRLRLLNQELLKEKAERQKAEVELRHAQKLEAVGQLAAGIAHEINTPIQFVGDSLHFLHEGFDELNQLIGEYQEVLRRLPKNNEMRSISKVIAQAEDAADLEYLKQNIPQAFDRINDGVSRIARIVRAMKEFGHPGGKIKGNADLIQCLKNTLTITRHEYKFVADIRTHFEPIPKVLCFESDLNQVFLNMIINATHAIAAVVKEEKNKGVIEISTRQVDDTSVEIKIRDNGAGIPQSIRQRIYEPFFTTKEVGTGTGQGLAIAHSIVVEKHKGSIRCESEVGQGTTFLVHLPIDSESL